MRKLFVVLLAAALLSTACGAEQKAANHLAAASLEVGDPILGE